MMRKIIAFDLDGTLAPSKSALPDQMSTLLSRLLQKYEVCVISGGKFGQFETQLLGNLQASSAQLEKLHIMPTCGTQYYIYDASSSKWSRQYAELIENTDKKRIIDALNKGFDELGYRVEKTYGETVEDRGSQITYSVLGQDIVDHLGEEGLKMKYAWDPDNSKKQAVRDFVAPLIPDFEVRVGGVTSIDVTRPGIDKAYGIGKLLEMLSVSRDEVLFIGDRLEEGGNDYPVRAIGIDTIAVTDWTDTQYAIEGILGVTAE